MRRDVSLMILYDREKRVLLQHRAKDAVRAPDFWAFFGGGIDQGETPDQALAREAMEELHWTVKNPRKLFVFDAQPFGKESLLHVYVEECLDASALILGEGQGWGWFHFEEIKDLKISPWDREIVKQVIDAL